MASKRGFGRAFGIPVGFQGDFFAEEPQAQYDSSKRSMPGQWPEEYSCTDDVSALAPNSALFTTAARFATSMTLEVCKLPWRLAQRFTQLQQIRAVPIVRDDGASKRRLVDAGLTAATPTRQREDGARQGTPRQHSRIPDVTRSHVPGLWVDAPHISTFDSLRYLEDLQDDDNDDNLDWSMENVDSITPSRNQGTGSSNGVSWLCRPERRIVSPKLQPAISKRSSATPMRKQLLKKQLLAVKAVTVASPIQQQLSHTLASLAPQNPSIGNLKRNTLESSVLSITAPTVAANAQEVSARYNAELEARENRDADARTIAERSYYNSIDTLNTDISLLPDAGQTNSTVTPYTTTSSPLRKRNVCWASQSSIKPFYFDERISGMLDSTLESIRSPIPKPNLDDDEEEEEEEEDDYSKDLRKVTVDDPDLTTESDCIDVPSLDESIEESQLSKELLQELEENFKNLLAQAPPPPPPSKPLIFPLSKEERAQLDDIVTKSRHGRNETFPIIPHKVTARDFGTLLPNLFNGSAKAWLNDEIVDQYLTVLVKQWNEGACFAFKRGGPAPPYHAFSSHWYNSIKGGIKNVERWANRVGLGGKQFLDAKLVLYPICDASHWRLLAVKPQERIIEYLDSLGWDGDKYVDKLRLYLKHELKDLYKDNEWTTIEYQRSSRQLNGSDCGVFVLLNALVLLRGDDTKKVIACNGMLEARERMAVTIITGHATELDK